MENAGNADARQAEMIGAIVVSGFRVRVSGYNVEAKFLGRLFDLG